MENKTQRLFMLPGIDAKLLIMGNTISFLAQGNCQVIKNGKVIGYKKRNPERLALMKHIFPKLRNVSVIRYGKKDNKPVYGSFQTEDLHKYRKKSKTYRFDVIAFVNEELINSLGLIETTGKRLSDSQIFRI